MKAYIKPIITELGKSSELIKGACGWGNENIYFNKTGGVKTTIKNWSKYCDAWYCYCTCVSQSACDDSTDYCAIISPPC